MNQMQPRSVNAWELRNERCQCGEMFFEKSYVLKTIPGLMIGQKDSSVNAIEIYRCSKCHAVPANFLIAIKEPELPVMKVVPDQPTKLII